ncbi:unnamed protein product [Rhizophagus irregularis]|nr:unnamed protein product [Rhizophagus irregularis]CAB5383419.1 unnamed protein product [Rhizophagus irregularis]
MIAICKGKEIITSELPETTDILILYCMMIAIAETTKYLNYCKGRETIISETTKYFNSLLYINLNVGNYIRNHQISLQI